MDREVRVSDVTLKRLGDRAEDALSFKEKLELSKLLDRIGAAVIEIEGVSGTRMDALRIKSIAAAVKSSASTSMLRAVAFLLFMHKSATRPMASSVTRASPR